MIHTIVSIGILVVFSTALPIQRSGAERPAALEGPLKPLKFLIGACWTGTFASGARDTHCFESLYGGHFVRDRHRVAGAAEPYEGETLYRWDAEARVIRYTYYNSDGGVSEGTAHADGATVTFPETHRDRSGKVQEYRNVWRQTSPDEYIALTERRTATGWQQSFKIVFRRERQ